MHYFSIAMKNLLLPVIVLVALASCSSSKEEYGAVWEASPASFAGVKDVSDFTMNGKFIFDGDEVNIQAYGFDGCVFSKDTLDHTLKWKISNDSLITYNDEDTPGMVYTIMDTTDNLIHLQLMEDIFLTLEK